MLANGFISKLLKKKVFNIKPIVLCFKISPDLLNLHVCKSQACCAGFSTSMPAAHPSERHVAFNTGVFRTGSFYCSFFNFNQIIHSVSS